MKLQLKAFKKGGVHPHEFKLTSSLAIVKAHMPKIVRLPMTMHLGAPAVVKVKEGDKIEEGQLIGEASGFVSANVHASVSGKVIAVTKADTLNAKGVDYVEIETGGSIRNWYDKKNDYSKMSSEQLLEKVKNAGIVGMGGATFPTHVKLAPGKKKTEVLIVNGAECEPFLTIDHRLMLEKAEDILSGVRIVKKITGAAKVFIGIEENKLDAIEHLMEAVKDDADMEVVPLRTRYPQGGEKQLIQAITGLEVPSGGLPLDLGVVVVNVSTAFAIYEAVTYDKPLIERGLTYTGLEVAGRGNYKVRIGTPIASLVEELGLPEKHGTIISGGPMMGLEVTDLNLPVTKGTSGIVVLQPKQDYEVKHYPCIRCSRCVMTCPVGLQPTVIADFVDNARVEDAEANGLLDCIECGSCSFVCPSYIPLVGLIRFGKILWRKKQQTKK